MRGALRLALSLFFALAAGALHGPAEASFTVPPNNPGQYRTRDNCTALPGAAAFRARLADAVSRRDIEAFAALTSPQVELDFGGGAGHAQLREMLGGEGGPVLWRELDEILTLGCETEEGKMFLPWFYWQDLGDADPFSTMVAMGEAVPVLARPRAGARRIATLDWQLVVVQGDDFDAARPWHKVWLLNSKKQGYVASKWLRAQIDYRIYIEQIGGEWRITAFIAGD